MPKSSKKRKHSKKKSKSNEHLDRDLELARRIEELGSEVNMYLDPEVRKAFRPLWSYGDPSQQIMNTAPILAHDLMGGAPQMIQQSMPQDMGMGMQPMLMPGGGMQYPMQQPQQPEVDETGGVEVPMGSRLFPDETKFLEYQKKCSEDPESIDTQRLLYDTKSKKFYHSICDATLGTSDYTGVVYVDEPTYKARLRTARASGPYDPSELAGEVASLPDVGERKYKEKQAAQQKACPELGSSDVPQCPSGTQQEPGAPTGYCFQTRQIPGPQGTFTTKKTWYSTYYDSRYDACPDSDDKDGQNPITIGGTRVWFRKAE